MEFLVERFFALLPRYAAAGAAPFHPAGETFHARLAREEVRVFECADGGTPVNSAEVPAARASALPGIWCRGVPLHSSWTDVEVPLRRFHELLVPHGVLAVGFDGTAPAVPLLDRAGFDLVGRFPGAGGVEYLLGTKRADCCSGRRRILHDRSGFTD
ncbi:hypothetical protein [Streptacidiphilus cavernicola]|uniref:Uncharacterized protein n=1 Tax=Streptacidiphilus cavernicola TaxID=3342716 RepID=A0ABV6VVN2_9ACTN